MIVKITDMKKVKHLFENWQEACIWSCLQSIMGEIYADDLENPKSAKAILGDFCFLAGKPNKELIRYKPEGCLLKFIIMVPQGDAWNGFIEESYGDGAKKVTRYAIKKEGDVFDRKKLKTTVDSLDSTYTLKMMDVEIYNYCRTADWCKDWVSNYSNYEIYAKSGLGAVVLKGGAPVSGASSYASYQGGIEIEIDTKEEYRRQGLASVCGAKLILECLERDWYPSWDAQNKWSVGLAEKLGYHFDHEYAAYEIRGY